MKVCVVVDGETVAELVATNLWRDLVIYSADRWAAEEDESDTPG